MPVDSASGCRGSRPNSPRSWQATAIGCRRGTVAYVCRRRRGARSAERCLRDRRLVDCHPQLAVFGVPGLTAVASPLPATIPPALAAAIPHLRSGTARPRAAAWSLLDAVPATAAGSLLSRLVGGASCQRGDRDRVVGRPGERVHLVPVAGRYDEVVIVVPGAARTRLLLASISTAAECTKSMACSSNVGPT